MTKNSATIIDHIWTNDFDNYLTSGILFCSISDHFPIFSSFSTCRDYTHSSVIFTRRRLTDVEVNAFKMELSNYNWNLDTLNHDVNYLFNRYMNNVLKLYNKHFPVSTTKIKTKYLDKPYITPPIK